MIGASKRARMLRELIVAYFDWPFSGELAQICCLPFDGIGARHLGIAVSSGSCSTANMSATPWIRLVLGLWSS